MDAGRLPRGILCRQRPRRRGENEDHAVIKEWRSQVRRWSALARRLSLNFVESKTRRPRIITEKTYFT
jgi:hypothetical protein